MLRRFVSKKPAACALQTARRTFFYDGAGEAGIVKATMKQCIRLTQIAIWVTLFWVYKVVFGKYSNRNQFLDDTTDLWESDGTEMEGEEAVANLRIQYERLTPFMADIKAQLEAKGIATE